MTRGGRTSGPYICDLVVDMALGESGGHTQCFFEVIHIGRAVSNETHALHAEQRSATVFGMVKALLEIVKRAAREQISHLAGEGSLKGLLQGGAHQICYALRSLQGYVSLQPVVHLYI